MQNAIATTLSEELTLMPSHEKWEIIDGALFMQAAASPRHAYARLELTPLLRNPYDRGKGGPGGWIILDEIRFKGPNPERHTLEPDIAGWRRERLPAIPAETIRIAPDWVCEILSPSTMRIDRGLKMETYAELRVRDYWLLNPDTGQLETYRLSRDAYDLVACIRADEHASPEPFPDLSFTPGDLIAPAA